MVNFEDPVVLLQDILIVAKVWSVMDGLYLWEFITNLDYEWSFIRGRRTHNWTIWIYSFTRLGTLITVVLNLLAIDANSRIYNCEADVLLQAIFGYLSVSTASLLIVLRILAIWNRRRIVVAITVGTWVVNFIFTIQSLARIRAGWTFGNICEIINLNVARPNTLVTLAANITLLVIMFIGLLSNHLYESSTAGIGRLLWKQGLIWLLIATIAEVLPAVFIFLDPNNPFGYIFQLPSLIANTIAATRIHRSLTEFVATTSYSLPRIFDSNRSPVSSADARARPPGMPMPVPLNRMEVAVHKTYDRYEMGPTSHHVSFAVAGGEPRNKRVARPVPDIEEETASAETEPVTDAELESNAVPSKAGTSPQYSVMDTTNA